jgi:hypothetical protein
VESRKRKSWVEKKDEINLFLMKMIIKIDAAWGYDAEKKKKKRW